MLRLLKIELNKILSYSTFWVLSLITLGIYVFLLLIISQVSFNVDGIDINVYFRFSTVWQTIAYYSSWFNLLLVLLLIIIIGNEFNFKTFRQNAIDGLTRQELFFSKLILIILFAITAFIISFLSALTIGFVYTNNFDTSYIFNEIHFIFAFFVQALGFMSIAFYISLLLKNTAASIVIFIGVYIFELITRGFFAIMSISWGQYLPFNVLSNLCKAPSINKMITNEMMKESLVNATNNMQTGGHFIDMDYSINLILGVLFIVVFFYLSYLRLTKKDL